MASARPLRDVFADLVGAPSGAGDPAALLREQGHPGLPDDLVAEAVVSYADTAPVEVAEHLAPYVTAHSAVGAEPTAGGEPATDWLGLLGTAPDVAGEPADLDGLVPAAGGFGAAAEPGPEAGPEPGLDFGTGAGPQAATVTAGGAEEEDGVEFLADPAEPDEHDEAAGWEPVGPAADLTADLTAEESGADEPEPLG